ncbi:MAG: DCC1-like thiol-disulfide oxidoreductase family protein [Planctomycetaceae bacterium]
MSESTAPSSNILFFDGVCGFCNHTVNWIMLRDRSHRIQFAPLQGTTAEKIVPTDLRQNLSTLVFHTPQGDFIRTAAVCRILMTLGGIWWLLGSLLWLIPFPLRDLGYRFIAKIRYRLFGKHESCRIPTAEERSRFLN